MRDCISEAFTEEQRAGIRQELDRILASPAFRQSKRYSAFLRYIVEETLSGRADQLKERCIGCEVFDREPDYDTSVDHVVRSAAGEVRRRIAQSYLDITEGSGVRFELRPGSYVPHFRFPASRAAAPAAPAAHDRWRARLAIIAGCILACVAVAGAVAGVSRQSEADALDALTADTNDVLLSVSDSQGGVAARDAFTLAHAAAAVAEKGKAVRFRTQSTLTSADLASGPSVLIGGWSDPWTQRLLRGFRYRFEDGAILDGQDSGRRWSVQRDGEVVKDFALLTKFRDRESGRTIVVAAGLTEYGTETAVAFLARPESVASAASGSLDDWKHRNVQIILATDVFRGSAGTPEIVGKHVW